MLWVIKIRQVYSSMNWEVRRALAQPAVKNDYQGLGPGARLQKIRNSKTISTKKVLLEGEREGNPGWEGWEVAPSASAGSVFWAIVLRAHRSLCTALPLAFLVMHKP